MPTFQPPSVADVPPVLPDTRGPARRLFAHLGPYPRGRSVLKARDGTYTTVDTPYAADCDAAAVCYLGGHIYDVTSAEAAALTAAGYGGYIT